MVFQRVNFYFYKFFQEGQYCYFFCNSGKFSVSFFSQVFGIGRCVWQERGVETFCFCQYSIVVFVAGIVLQDMGRVLRRCRRVVVWWRLCYFVCFRRVCVFWCVVFFFASIVVYLVIFFLSKEETFRGRMDVFKCLRDLF